MVDKRVMMAIINSTFIMKFPFQYLLSVKEKSNAILYGRSKNSWNLRKSNHRPIIVDGIYGYEKRIWKIHKRINFFRKNKTLLYRGKKKILFIWCESILFYIYFNKFFTVINAI